MLATAIAGIVLTGVYRIAITCLELNQEVSELQQREAVRKALLSLIRREFRHLSADAEFVLEQRASDAGPISVVTLSRAPMAFRLGAVGASERVQLILEPSGSGNQRALLRYQSEELPSRDLALIDQITSSEWRCLDPATGLWKTEWQAGATRPSLVALHLGFDGEPAQRHLFWIPAVVPSGLQLQPLDPGIQP